MTRTHLLLSSLCVGMIACSGAGDSTDMDAGALVDGGSTVADSGSTVGDSGSTVADTGPVD